MESHSGHFEHFQKISNFEKFSKNHFFGHFLTSEISEGQISLILLYFAVKYLEISQKSSQMSLVVY